MQKNKTLTNKSISIAASFIWAAIVFYLHVVRVKLPEDEPLFRIPHADKFVHFTMFVVMAFILARTVEVQKQHRPKLSQLFIIVIACAGYGALLEYLQGVMPNQRDSDVLDWIADLLGSITGVLVASTSWFPLFFHLQRRK